MATDSPAPRRSQREKKPSKPFISVESTASKRKRNDSDTEDEGPEASEQEDAQPPEDEDEDDEEEEQGEYRAPRPAKVKATPVGRKGKGKATPKARGPPLAKKPRTTKAPATKTVKTTTRKPRKGKDGEDTFNAAQVAKDTRITGDNPLFNAVMNPSAALQSTAEDFLESLAQTPGPAQAELINLILRACGCNDSVDPDEVLDYDGVVDALDNFTEGLKKDDSPVYPLTSKLLAFKKFRKSLSEFIERLIASSADLGSLYTSDLMATLQTWVIAMSSSQIRSFRHTATVVALEVETALCDVAAAVEKEAEVVGRQREGEKKRKASNKGAGVRDKELEGKAAEVRERRNKLAEFLKEFVDGVFVHRYRDLDPNIRAECVHAIGLWFKKYPGHFLDGSYLRYVGWVLSDSNTQVRLEAVRALSGVYEQVDYIGSLNHFTERFKPRLIEMATGDTELNVRVAVIQVVEAIDGHSLLEDEEREKLCLLVFDEEPKVRKAVSGFVRGVWDEAVDERLVGRNKPSKQERERAGVKALAVLLVKWGKTLDNVIGDEDDSDGSGEAINTGEGSSRPSRKELAALVAMSPKGRTALAVEALWDEVEPVSNWDGLLDVLLLDHSAAGEDAAEVSTRGRRANGKGSVQDSVVDEAWRLEEVEESVLLEVLVAALRRAKAEVAGNKKGEEETVTNDITRALIKGLPRLFIKHQTDQNRIADVLLIPPLMNLDLYLEMRMITGYASLWDDVTKQFLSHSSLTVLTHAVAAIRHFMEATSLSNTNSTKILELEDELSSFLRDAVAGRDEIEVASFTEDEVLSLGALCARLAVLAGTRDMTAWIEEDEGGKQSSAWDIISALIERGSLGYKEEEAMIDKALHLLTLHIIWKRKGLTADVEPSPEEIRFRETLQRQRESLLEKLIEYAVGTRSNTIEGVKRAAFQNLLHLHVLFSSAQTIAADGSPLSTASLALTLDDEAQYRCAGFIQAEIEQYADALGDGAAVNENGSDTEESSGDEADDTTKGKKRKAGKDKKPDQEVDPTSRTRLEQEYVFIDVMSTFLRAIRAGAIHIRHGATLLAHYGRLGPSFDMCSKVIVDVLREEGMMNNNGEVVANVVTQALQESFTLVLDGVVRDETHSIGLSKLLASCFVIRGSQLSIVKRLDSQFIVQVHTTLLTWIGKRLATYESNKNKKSLKTAILFFKVLLPLLGVIQSRDALKIKAHMDQILAQAKVEVSGTAKNWEPQRAYEKRLGTAMSKDKTSGTKGRKAQHKGAKSTPLASSDEEESDAEKLMDEGLPSHPAQDIGIHLETPLESVEQDIEPENPDPTTPKARVRPKATYRTKPPTMSPDKSPQRSPAISPAPSASGPEVNGLTTPTTSRKRARPEEDEEPEQGDAPSPLTDSEVESMGDVPQPSPSDMSPGNGIRIRKRVRH